jgi:DNA-binding NarL/FixJ family response regulator
MSVALRARDSQTSALMPGDPPTLVAVFNSNDDIVEMLRVALELSGFLVVTGHVPKAIRGEFDLPGFVARTDPKAIVYDISPPYERNWNYLLHLRQRPELRDRRFVLTSTHAARVMELAKTDVMVHEILGKPYDINAIVQAVAEAAVGKAPPVPPLTES